MKQRRRAALDTRYRIDDEPGDPPLARIAIPALILLPVTVYCTLFFSVFFLLLPGLNGLLVAGNHKWRDVGLSVLSLFLSFASYIVLSALYDADLLHGLTLDYAKDIRFAITVFPLIKVMFDQYYTASLRRALKDWR